mmetsp:Transcript_24400/g.50705  ORF Transcript_24400/g.50705 Transcript_24400/m.50705 type:complete len:295 (-) Transcript_24400:43-927(-)
MVSVPQIGFGTYLISQEDVVEPVCAAIQAGYRHVDTAEGYGNEVGVGKAISKSEVPRDELFVTTKLWPGNPAWGQPAKTYEECLAACEQSLKNLSLDYVDLYLIHAPFGFSAGLLQEQYRALVNIKERGLAREIGVSNFSVKHLEALESAGLPTPAYNQLELHPLCQQTETLSWMEKRGCLPIAYSSLAPMSGWRAQQESGKHRLGEQSEVELAKTLKNVATRLNATEAQVLLLWGLQKGYRILPKSTNKQRIELNLQVQALGALTQQEMQNLESCRPSGEDVCLAWSFGDPSL